MSVTVDPVRPRERSIPVSKRRASRGGTPRCPASPGKSALAQRLVWAKRKIRHAAIPYRVPRESELPDRLRSVLAVVYLVCNEGHTASSGKELVREDLCAEAIRLGRLLA